eukprot:2852170-Amphidinium_carterae.1
MVVGKDPPHGYREIEACKCEALVAVAEQQWAWHWSGCFIPSHTAAPWSMRFPIGQYHAQLLLRLCSCLCVTTTLTHGAGVLFTQHVGLAARFELASLRTIWQQPDFVQVPSLEDHQGFY